MGGNAAHNEDLNELGNRIAVSEMIRMNNN
jgi:hypothetical protein